MSDSGTMPKQLSDTQVEAPLFVAYTHMPQAEEWLERHLGKDAPVQLPDTWRDNFVRYTPWIALVFLPLHLLAVLLLLGVNFLAALLGHVSVLSGIFAVAILVCDVLALPGLFGRTRDGWKYFLYALVLGGVRQLTHISLFGLLIQVVLLWMAFQVKYRYGAEAGAGAAG